MTFHTYPGFSEQIERHHLGRYITTYRYIQLNSLLIHNFSLILKCFFIKSVVMSVFPSLLNQLI